MRKFKHTVLIVLKKKKKKSRSGLRFTQLTNKIQTTFDNIINN